MQSPLWNGYSLTSFECGARSGLIVSPHTSLAGKPWIWRTEFFDAFPQVDLALLKSGFHLAYLDVQDLYGAPVALDAMDLFYLHVIEHFGLSPMVTLEGFSRGGLFAFNWAARHPKRITCLYVDAPVCDFKSWPAGRGTSAGSPVDWEQCKRVYGLNEESASTYSGNPIETLALLAAAHIPILAVCGDTDDVVPMEENIAIVEKQYQTLSGEIKVIVKPGCGHHPHSLEDPAPIIHFILDHTSPRLSAGTAVTNNAPFS